MKFLPARTLAVTALCVVTAGCSGEVSESAQAAAGAQRGAIARPSGPGADVRAFTGARTRIVWVQGDGTDPETEGTQLVLMGLDTDDGKGERVILGERRSYVKPRLTARADRVVFSSRILPGPPEIFVVNWDGTGFRKLADGFAMALWRNPADGSDWVYAGTDNKKLQISPRSGASRLMPLISASWFGTRRSSAWRGST